MISSQLPNSSRSRRFQGQDCRSVENLSTSSKVSEQQFPRLVRRQYQEFYPTGFLFISFVGDSFLRTFSICLLGGFWGLNIVVTPFFHRNVVPFFFSWQFGRIYVSCHLRKHESICLPVDSPVGAMCFAFPLGNSAISMFPGMYTILWTLSHEKKQKLICLPVYVSIGMFVPSFLLILKVVSL